MAAEKKEELYMMRWKPRMKMGRKEGGIRWGTQDDGDNEGKEEEKEVI